MTFNPRFTRSGGNVCRKNYTTTNCRRATLSRDVCHRIRARDRWKCKSIKLVSRRKLDDETLNFAIVVLPPVSFSTHKDQYFNICANKLRLLPSEIVIVRHRGYYDEATIQFYRYKYGTRDGWNSFIIFASHRWKAKRLKLRARNEERVRQQKKMRGKEKERGGRKGRGEKRAGGKERESKAATFHLWFIALTFIFLRRY